MSKNRPSSASLAKAVFDATGVRLRRAPNSGAPQAGFGVVLAHLLDAETRDRFASPSEEVDKGEVVRGYGYERGQYVTFTPDELKALDLESSKVIDLGTFVSRSEVDPVYFNSPYYLYPDGQMAVDTIRVIGAVMAEAAPSRAPGVRGRGTQNMTNHHPNRARRRYGHLLGHIRNAFLEAVEAFEDWNPSALCRPRGSATKFGIDRGRSASPKLAASSGTARHIARHGVPNPHGKTWKSI